MDWMERCTVNYLTGLDELQRQQGNDESNLPVSVLFQLAGFVHDSRHGSHDSGAVIPHLS